MNEVRWCPECPPEHLLVDDLRCHECPRRQHPALAPNMPASALPASSLDIPLPRKPKPASAPEIARIDISHGWESNYPEWAAVGYDGVTRIVKQYYPGPGCDGELPYVQVWKGDHLHAEYAQHMIVGVIYKTSANA